MALSDEIQRLTQHFLEAYEDRMAAVADIRTSTVEELAEFRAAHQQMAEEQRQRLAEGRARLASDTAAFLEELDAAHQQMAAELRAHLEEQESERLAQAAEDARGRADYVAALKSDTAVMVSDFERARQEMAAEQRQRLVRDRARLAWDVAAMRGGLQAEQSEAWRVWRNFATLMRERRAGRPAAPPAAVEAAGEVEEVTPDDLTAIRGIGLGLQSRLNEAGIYTYAQLARSTPQELRQVLGAAARLANVEAWIEQARELAGLA